MFSGGLYGSMTHRIYSQLINDLKKDFTIINFNNIGLTKREDLESLADALGVKKIGFISHSSVDHTILESNRLEKAVLCDPVGLPNIQNGFTSSTITSIAPVLLLNDEKAYNSEFPFIINGFSLDIMGADVIEETFQEMGHADILDDTWANVAGHWGIEGVKFSPSKLNFDEWSNDLRQTSEKTQIRNEYRSKIASKIKDFFFQKKDEVTTVEILKISDQ